MIKDILKIRNTLRRNIESTTENINNGYFAEPELVLRAADSRRTDALGLLVVDALGLLGALVVINLGISSFVKLTDFRR